jgi:hypothetical protein
MNNNLRVLVVILIAFFSFNPLKRNSQIVDSTLSVVINSNHFNQNDSINFEASLKNINSDNKLITLHLWIEEITTGRRWHYRYPLINGYVNASLKIDEKISNGKYAFNFSLQKSFFSLFGKIKNEETLDTKFPYLNYVLISKEKQTMVDVVPLQSDNTFAIQRLLFEDTSYIIFSKPKRKKNDLQIAIRTPLDSSFIPEKVVTQFITVGPLVDSSKKQIDVNNDYSFNTNSSLFKTILPPVEIISKTKKQIEDFQKENVTGFFSGSEDVMIDGLSSEEIANAPDLYNYLTTKVAGLRVNIDNETGNRFLSWRKKPTDIYINELKMDADAPYDINPADIALIKIYRPGAMLSASSGEGGAIAIYLKTGAYQKSTNRNYSFYIIGYKGLQSSWQ